MQHPSDQPPKNDELVRALHASPPRGVLAVTGGGSGAISALLQAPGASNTVLEAIVPYAEQSLTNFLRGRVDSACSESTARSMAVASYERARVLTGREEFDAQFEQDPGGLFGLGCTASLATTRAKRGDHRIHVAVQTAASSSVWSLRLAKGERTRAEEEAIATRLVLHALANALEVTATAEFTASPGDNLTHHAKTAPPLWQSMLWGDGQTALIDPKLDTDGCSAQPRCERVLFSGAFDPPHAGHRRIVEFAEKKLGRRVTLELSLTNVDKPRIDYLAVDNRLRAIAEVFDEAEVWLTRLPTFQQKAKQFPGATFLVGADTVLRIADPKYYGHPDHSGDETARNEAIQQIANLDCRFLVFGRLVGDEFETLDDLKLPPGLAAICDGVTADEFREDISSTGIRRADQE